MFSRCYEYMLIICLSLVFWGGSLHAVDDVGDLVRLAETAPLNQAPTRIAAWHGAWVLWWDARTVHAQDEATRQLLETEALTMAAEMVVDPRIPIAGVWAGGDWLLLQRQFWETESAYQLAWALADRLMSEPMDDAQRVGAPAGREILKDWHADVMAQRLGDACGILESDPGFMRRILASPRWRLDAEARDLMRHRFARDADLSAAYLLEMLDGAPENWDLSTLKTIAESGGTVEERTELLGRVVAATLAGSPDAKALEIRARLLIDISRNRKDNWGDVLDDQALTLIDQALGSLDDVRMAALPWLVLFHPQRAAVEAVLVRRANRILSWTIRLGEDGMPESGIAANSDAVVREPWSATMPLVPLVFVDGDIDEATLHAMKRYLGFGLSVEGPMVRADMKVGHAVRVAKAAISAIAAQRPDRMRSWWQDPEVHYHSGWDPMLHDVLVPQAFRLGLQGPWTELPTQVNDWGGEPMPLRWQSLMIPRSGPTPSALIALRTAFAMPGDDVVRLLYALVAAPALREQFPEAAALLPQELALHPLTHQPDANEAAHLIDLHRAWGDLPTARRLVHQAAEKAREARLSQLTVRLRHNRQDMSPAELAESLRILDRDEPWTWTAVQARQVLLAPDAAMLTPTLAAIAAERGPIGPIARWIVARLRGDTQIPDPTPEQCLAAARDERFVELCASLTLVGGQEEALAVLSDPRILRGWSAGPPFANWFSAGPDGQPLIDFLATLTTLRLQTWVANEPPPTESHP